MILLTDKQQIRQLDKRKGGYYYLQISRGIVEGWEEKRKTRLICTLENDLSFRCGLNHLGDGNYFVILSGSNLKKIGKESGDTVSFRLSKDPDPLGVPVPEVLEILLEQNPDVKEKFRQLTVGKKRNLIHQVIKIKDLDRQVAKALALIMQPGKPRPKKQL